METVKYMSNTNKNIIFVAANIMNISVKFQLYPPFGFWGDDIWKFFHKSSPRLHWQSIKFRDLDKNHMLGRGLLTEPNWTILL